METSRLFRKSKMLKSSAEKVGSHLTNMVVWQSFCPNDIPLATFPQWHHVFLKCLLSVGFGCIYPFRFSEMQKVWTSLCTCTWRCAIYHEVDQWAPTIYRFQPIRSISKVLRTGERVPKLLFHFLIPPCAALHHRHT